ncbi:hypothetical protein KQI30_10095 [Clostridium bornimense]|uniref:hypothetical protein n=1 Tax=Clostridium bornimense TaxID=1216932 RepID=UPI001C119830|nr:hypothetical protein [Clostridium bornimense]MBU5316621.1 hypothetical protein [Clostridium bornimense]
MIDLNKLISGDISNYSEEEVLYIKEFRSILRDVLIDEIVKNKIFKFENEIKNNKNKFEEEISSIIINGIKGLNDMTTEVILNIYLEDNNQENFIALIEKVEKDTISKFS